jgi:uncharacterized phage protein gp47/JayE
MALLTPDTAKEVSDRAKADAVLELGDVGAKPFLANSWLGSLITAFSNRIFDFYQALVRAELEAIPDTAVENLDRWAAIWGVNRTAGAVSSGNVVAGGTVGSSIQAGVLLAHGDGREYEVQTTVAIAATTGFAPSAGGLTNDLAGTATFVSATPHGIASNIPVTITGAVETEYNVTNATITVISATSFSYSVTGSPASPATGSPVAAWDSAAVAVESLAFGIAEDLASDDALRFQSPVAGVNDTAVADANGVGGGSDRETDEALRARLLDRIQNPVAHFNVAEITAVAKTVAGVTRVFVEEITPSVGQVTIYFMRDNDVSAIPDGAEVAAVKAVIDAIRPATSDAADVIVSAPAPITTAYTFTNITPDTATMRTAIEANLAQFYAERVNVGVNIDEDAYRAAIFGTVDTVTGDSLTTFTLSAPSGDIVIAAGEIGVLGTVSFP